MASATLERGIDSAERAAEPRSWQRLEDGPAQRFNMSNILRLWTVAHTTNRRRESLIVVLICVVTGCAQMLMLSLPVLSGKIVSELTGGETHGESVDGTRVAWLIVEALAVVVVLITLRCSASLAMMLTGIRWRAALTERLHQLYLRHMAYYAIQHHESVDNPDQRMASDASNFTKICCGGVSPPYASVLESLVGHLSLALAATAVSVQRAGLAVTAVNYCYNIATIVVNLLVSAPIAGATDRMECREGDFRSAHLRLRTYAESVAFYAGSRVEQAVLEERLSALLRAQRGLTLDYFKLMVTLTFTSVGGSFVGLLIAAMSIWSGGRTVYSVAELSAVLGTLDMLTGSIQALPGLLPQLATVAGLGARLTELHDVLEALQTPRSSAVKEDHFAVGCVHLHWRTPDGKRTLGQGLTFDVRRGGSLVIVGNSGCGKSALLRCIAGLWAADSGTVYRPMTAGRDGALFLPQRPYMALGSLRAQVTYPTIDQSPGADDVIIKQVLHSVGLGGVVAGFGLHAVMAWEDVLSGGEQQRLGFARLLFHRPRFALLDEATSALDPASEAHCMRLVQTAGIAVISVAHRPSLLKFHDMKLTLGEGGMHTLVPVTQAEKAMS